MVRFIVAETVYPLPRMTDMLDALSRAKIFSILDATSGYWQIPLQEEDKQKTGFITREGLFQFKVMPFRLKNAPENHEHHLFWTDLENVSTLHG